MNISKINEYESLRKFLERRIKIKPLNSISYMLLDIYLKAEKPTSAQWIGENTLKEYKVIPNIYHSVGEFRDAMIHHSILICQASLEERQKPKPCSNANRFKFGTAIKKYIESALLKQKSIREALDDKASDKRVDELEEKINMLIAYVMFKNPPDNENRRTIASTYYDDPVKMEQMLREELEEVRKLTTNNLPKVKEEDANVPF